MLLFLDPISTALCCQAGSEISDNELLKCLFLLSGEKPYAISMWLYQAYSEFGKSTADKLELLIRLADEEGRAGFIYGQNPWCVLASLLEENSIIVEFDTKMPFSDMAVEQAFSELDIPVQLH